jgi:3-dehydrosphinganine reductase
MLTQMLEKDDKPQDPDTMARILVSDLEAGRYMLTTAPIGHIMRGWAFSGSQRTSFLDYFWSWLGSIIVLFVVPNFLSKCRKWGMEKGLTGAR